MKKKQDILNILGNQSNLSENDIYDIQDGRIDLNCYLELSDDCNCSCSFCRNHFFENRNYNFKNILSTSALLLPYLKEIDIGGGEPTLKMDDLITFKKILTYISKVRYLTNYNLLNGMENRHIHSTTHNYLGVLTEMLKSKNNIYNKNLKRINFVVFSNGTSSVEHYENLIESGFSIAFSRHHYDDLKNKQIFNSTSNIITGKEIGDLYGKIKTTNYRFESYYRSQHIIPYLDLKAKDVYFDCVLSQEGLNSINDMANYLYWLTGLETGEYFGKKMNVVFSQLEHNSKSNAVPVTSEFINSIDDWFIRDKGRTILSSSGYTITPYRFDIPHAYHKDFKFYVKKYVDENSLEEMWKYANASEYKKVVDLSMDSEGNLYQDYQRSKQLLI